ncbi:TetR family transcriptional regulator [Metarhizobium album]|uniref:TetR family transcriptional regulator n=1 Tax=Metarhizobium album TaxID=2182425 RepID=A0A2U2DPM8_9HYPH|nr:TetR family transcriptional regulator C-terminal domain-containing protein [Rhizobium album]PWE55232.1 TetR family transcriptional regulator [Rhizobium album]
MSRRAFHRASETERRQDLIAATLDCIAEFGVQGATVRQIATRAGVTGGLIRHYFASKDQMVQAAYRETMMGMTKAAIDAADSARGDARTRLRSFIVANLTPPVTDPRTLSLWAGFIGHVRLDPVFGAIHKENYLVFRQALETLLADFLKEMGRVPSAAECRAQSIAINGLIDGLWIEGSLAADMFDETELAQVALRSVEAMLGLPTGGLEDTNKG